MLMVQVNPFIIEGYLSPEYFCDWWHSCSASLCLSNVDIPVDSQAEAGAHGYRFGRKTLFSDVSRVFAEVSSWCKHRARCGQDFAWQRFYHARWWGISVMRQVFGAEFKWIKKKANVWILWAEFEVYIRLKWLKKYM